jgi:hypothetical protein
MYALRSEIANETSPSGLLLPWTSMLAHEWGAITMPVFP